MVRYRKIVVFFVWFVVCYGLALAAWPLLKHPYGAAFRTGSVLLGAYRAAPVSRGVNDTELTIQTARGGTMALVSARRIGYLPTTLLLALVIATPLAWKRKRWALLWSFLLINAFVAARVVLQLAHARATQHLVDASPAWTKTLDALHQAFYTTNLPLLAPILIWMVTTLYRTQWLSADRPADPDDSP